ncbi:peroxidase 4-like [Arachis ipaensis]|uniref:peroxidase 4-like n=1 Tax=Arachis ipaensis TaxID=130454 RepID=UPI0007AF29E0|nr:peroxidase 4-like [Arachis ipaensis]XP_025647248.1 peroxidase 4-like [Arachis hypogaea]
MMKFLCVFLLSLVLCVVPSTLRAQLDPLFYKHTCPPLHSAVHQVLHHVSKGPAKDKRLFASLIRLHFHDCFVQGCDASILLNDTAAIKCEQLALPTINSIRRLDVVNLIKKKIEKICPGVVSCVDILALATEMSSEMSKGPNWQVSLGRRDSITTNFDLATSNIPGQTSNLPQLISKFEKKGFDVNDLVALSGAHIIDQVRCVLSDLPNCTNDGSLGKNIANLDPITPTTFDNNY